MTKKKEEEATPPQAEAPAEQELEALRKDLEAEKAKAEEYLDQWRRTAAEFANYRKRNDKEREELAKFANSLLMAKLLPVLDDLERALATVPDKLQLLTWVDGIILIHRKMQATLEQEGLTEIEAQGKAFDPTIHEAVIYEESDKHKEGEIIEVLQKGYKVLGRVLRPALVKVAKQKKAESESS